MFRQQILLRPMTLSILMVEPCNLIEIKITMKGNGNLER